MRREASGRGWKGRGEVEKEKMKGFLKGVHRLPHTLTSQFQKESKTHDPDFDALAAQYALLDTHTEKLFKQVNPIDISLTLHLYDAYYTIPNNHHFIFIN